MTTRPSMKTMIAAVAGCALALSACGGGGGSSEPPQVEPEQPTQDHEAGDGSFPRYDPQPANFVVRAFGGPRSSAYERYDHWGIEIGLRSLNEEMDIPYPVATIRFAEEMEECSYAFYTEHGCFYNFGDIGYEVSGHLPTTWPQGTGKASWHGIALGIATGGDPYAGTEHSSNPILAIRGDVHLLLDLDRSHYRVEIGDFDHGGYPDMAVEGFWHGALIEDLQLHFLGLDRTTLDGQMTSRWRIDGSFRGSDHSAAVGSFERQFYENHPNFPNHFLEGIWAASYTPPALCPLC